MPDPRQAYLQAMMGGGGVAQAPPVPQAPPMPAPVAPQDPMSDPAKEQEFIEEMTVDQDPTSQDADNYYADPELFDKEPQKGDKVNITMKVQSLGSKIGLTPLDVEYISDEEDESEDDDNY